MINRQGMILPVYFCAKNYAVSYCYNFVCVV